MEPITSAVTQYILLGTPLSPVAMFSLPVIVGGAIAFSGNPLTNSNLSLGVGAAFVSNIILALRNVAIKNLGDGDKPVMTLHIKLSQVPLISSWVLGTSFLVLYLEKVGVLPTGSPYIISMCLLSGIFHVAYSYVSTGMVLTQLSVVSHAVANIMKRVLVVLLLYMGGSRTAGVENFFGLLLCVSGLLLYAWDKRPKNSSKTVKSGVIGTSDYSVASSLVQRRRLAYFMASSTLILCACCSALYGVPSVQNTVSHTVSHLSKRSVNIIGARQYAHDCAGGLRRTLQESETPFTLESIPDWTFSSRSLEKPSLSDLEPDLSGYLVNDSLKIRDFLGRRLIEKSEESNYLSKKLRTPLEIIKETQRIHYNMFGDALGKFKFCILIDTADFENKGDPAITAGEIYFLARMGIELVWYCNTQNCNNANLDRAALLARRYSTDDLVIMVHGGGNINHYKEHDWFRFSTMEKFKGYQIFQFPQSIRVENASTPHWDTCKKMYCCNKNLTMVLRDLGSLEIARQNFNGDTKLIMAPDMAYHIGPVKRFLSPVFDILWIMRNDTETAGYSVKNLKTPKGLRVHVSDWHKFLTPKAGVSLERSFYAQVMGLFFLQRGRVVITDRVHGHILSSLLDIPHVLLDNQAHKLSNYHRTWNFNQDKVRITESPEEALQMGLDMLETFKDSIPPRVPFLTVDPTFKGIVYDHPETWYS